MVYASLLALNHGDRYLKLTKQLEIWLSEKYRIKINKNTAYDIIDNDAIYEDVTPEFQGGNQKLRSYISVNIDAQIPTDNGAGEQT